MTAVAFDVQKNTPLVLAEGQPLPDLDPDVTGAAAGPDAAAPLPFWTGDRVATMVAKALDALAPIYGDAVRAEAWELELIEASPAAGVIQELLPGVANSGDQLPLMARVCIVLLLFGALALMRVPAILAVQRQKQLAAIQAQRAPVGEGQQSDVDQAPAPDNSARADAVFGEGGVGSGRIGQR